MSLLDQLFRAGACKPVLSEEQQTAIRNLIKLTEERLWLARHYPEDPPPHIDYTVECNERVIQFAENSIQHARHMLDEQH